MCFKPGEEDLGESAMGLPQRTVRGPLLEKLPASLTPKDFQLLRDDYIIFRLVVKDLREWADTIMAADARQMVEELEDLNDVLSAIFEWPA